MRYSNSLKAGTALMLPLAMAACSGRDDATTPPPPPSPPPAASFQSQFGASFATTFDASNTTEAKEPAPTDVPALNNAANPIDG
jgi:hypothetical protein